jgi:APA family basic amino acid/polyamine antiporter
VFVGLLAGFANIDEIVELTNIGTLFAFVLVAIGILVLRRTNPDAPRPFRTPLVPFVPLLAVASCSYLMLELPRQTWERFFIWFAIGLVVYLAYGYRHSKLRAEAR